MNRTIMNPVVIMARLLYALLYTFRRWRYGIYRSMGHCAMTSLLMFLRTAGCLSIAVLIRCHGDAAPVTRAVIIAFALLIPVAQIISHDMEGAFRRNVR